jgi:glycosyltransferase involved in cell wall biosynthesis
MTQGKPIVATRTGGIPYQLEGGASGCLVEYGDVKGLAEAVAETLRDSSRAREMGARARSRVEEFQYPILASNLQAIYREIVSAVGN